VSDLTLTLAMHFGVVLAFALALRLRGHPVAFGPLLYALGAIVIYWVLLKTGSDALERVPALSRLHWNWGGKLIAIAVTLVMIRLAASYSRAELGLTLRQEPGSGWPAVVAIVLMCALSWGAKAVFEAGPDLSIERFLYQSTLPGIDEELFFRALLLAFLHRAFGQGRPLAGARVGPAELVNVFLFGAGHGWRIVHGAMMVDVEALVVTGLLGAGLTWLRQRTGSVLLPILTHNLLNIGESFF
jgi:uncharacterized protein